MVDNEVQRHREALKSPEVDVRRAAVRALGDIGPGAVDAVPELIKALDDEDIDLIAVWALGKIGYAARDAAPAMRRFLQKVGSRCRPMSVIRPQLLYLPEHKREPSRTNMTDSKAPVQASRHGLGISSGRRDYPTNELQEKALRLVGAYRIVERKIDGCLIVEATNEKRYFVDDEGHVFEEIHRGK